MYTLKVSKSGYWAVWMDGSVLSDPDNFWDTPLAVDIAHFSFNQVSVELPIPVSLPAQYVLAGRVVDARGDAAGGLRVALFPDAAHLSDVDLLTKATTDEAGAFSIPVPLTANDSELALGVTDPDEVFAPFTVPIALSQQDRTLDDPLRLPDIGSVVRGRVVDPDGKPMAGVEVNSLKYFDEDEMWLYYQSVQSDSNGYYTVKVRPGQPFALSYWTEGYLTEYYPNFWAPPATPSSPGTLQAASIASLPNADLNTVVMQSGFNVTVPVRWAGQTKVLEGVGVFAYPANHEQGDPSITELGTSDGESTLRLAAGTYDIVVRGTFMSPELETVTLTNVSVDRDTVLDPVELRTVGNTVTGVVRTGDAAVAGARVSVYYWDHEDPESPLMAGDVQTTDSDGRFSVVVRDGDAFSARVWKNGYETVWLGGGSVHPDIATPESTRVSEAGLDLGAINLDTSELTIGKVAGQDLSYCTAHVLWGYAWSSNTTAYGVKLPFAAKFFQNSYRTANVFSDGHISFGEPNDEMRSMADASVPVIAPFWSGTDLSNPDSGPVSYGSSPDGGSFCVTWNRMTRRPGLSDGWDTFQMILTDRSAAAGRAEGDFDITFNYDQLQWDTTGLPYEGSAVVGYSAGLGQPGTYVSMDGSGVPGTLTDGGSWPLVAHSLNSEHLGRYAFEIRNGDTQLSVGTVTGTLVSASDGQPIQGSVSACKVRATYSWCPWVKTDADGSFTLQGLPVGDYLVALTADGATMTTSGAVVKAGEVTDMGALRLRATASMPTGTSLTHRDMVNGVPVVFDGDELSLSVPNPCSSGQLATGTWDVIDTSGVSVKDGSLAVTGAALTAKVPALSPYHGQAHLETTVFCDGVRATSPAFDLYVDPSGNLFDRYGLPVTGATVTLLHADSSDIFAPLSTGSLLMSESNRVNPVTTPADGSFHWDVVPGSYQLQVSKDGCGSQTSPVLVVPPARVGLLFKLDCGSAPTPATSVGITGSPALGATLTAAPATFLGGSPLVVRDLAWLRDGVQVGSGESHVVVADDLGHSLSVVETVGAPAVENGLGEQLTFDSFRLTSAPVLVPQGNTGPCKGSEQGQVGSYALTFLAPLDGSTAIKTIANTMKSGRVVPVKVSIYDKCSKSNVTDPTRIVTIKTTAMTTAASTTDPLESYADAGASNTGANTFRWSADGFWIYNLDTKALGLITGRNYRVDVYVSGLRATEDTWGVLQPVK